MAHLTIAKRCDGRGERAPKSWESRHGQVAAKLPHVHPPSEQWDADRPVGRPFRSHPEDPLTRQTTPPHGTRRRLKLSLAACLAVAATGTLLSPAMALPAPAAAPAAQPAQPAGGAWEQNAYRGHVDVVRAPEGSSTPAPKALTGVVFDDRNKNSRQDKNERGMRGVTVSNGRNTVKTDAKGRYELPVFENMTAFVTQPRGYQVPVDEDNVAQFFYNHLPAGSPKLKSGGIAPTGATPQAVNFPLAKSKATQSPTQACAIGADVQTYNSKEVEYARHGVFTDLAKRTDYAGCGTLFIGDVVGDDLSVFNQSRDLTAMLNGPARFLPGNHDIDYDAQNQQNEFDSFRAQFGPEYYSYDAGTAHVVALSNIEYPTQVPAKKSDYTYALGEQQLEWLRQDIANTPQNKPIILAGHAPLLEFYYSDSHQVRELQEIYKILEGRNVTSLGGHTHMNENLRAGDLLAGWKGKVGAKGLPFTHLTVSAVAGHWYSGRELPGGYRTSVQRDGTPPGVLTLNIKNQQVVERFTVQGGDDSDQMALGLNTPAYRDWYQENVTKPRGEADELKDPLVVPRSDLGKSWLTSNFWTGSTGSKVTVSIDGATPTRATRTQDLRGEDVKTGVEYSDPAAIQEQFVGGGGLADRSMHLWRLDLPQDLLVGKHTAKVTATDVHGRSFTESLPFEVTG